ncbi:MAG: hypothetical protein JWR16_407 [Nevskia sp.]|nr:hypothetical protein [Nevskia sp.]
MRSLIVLMPQLFIAPMLILFATTAIVVIVMAVFVGLNVNGDHGPLDDALDDCWCRRWGLGGRWWRRIAARQQ